MLDDDQDAITSYFAKRALASVAVTQPAPDAAAKANILSRQTGAPAETVDRNLEQIQQQVQIAQAQQLLQNHPTLVPWISNPRNAAVAADDMPALASNSAAWQRMHGHDEIGELQAPAPTLFNSIKGVGTAFVESAKQIGAGIRGLAADHLPDIDLSRPGIPTLGGNMADMARHAQRDYLEAQANIDATTPAFKSSITRGLYGGVSSLAQMAPSVIAAFVLGPGAALTGAGLQQGLPAYEKYRARGAGPGMAFVGGSAEGAIEVVTEKLPLHFIVDKLGKTGAGHFIAGFLGRELPSELAATIGQNAVDTAIANPDKTWGDYIREQPDAAVQTALGTLIAGGFFAGAHHIAKHYNEKVEAAQAAANDVNLDRAMDGAAESKVRARDPEAFRQFVELHTQGTPIENVFVPAESVASFFQSQDQDYHQDDFWSNYASQIDEGLVTGGDVVVPTAVAAAHLAGTPAWEALRPDIRTSPGGLSMAEAKEIEKNRGEIMRTLGERLAEHEISTVAAGEQQRVIYEGIRDKLIAAGSTVDAAHVNALLVAQAAAARADRLGVPLTGNEADQIEVNRILPPNLAPIVAASPGQVAMKNVVAMMRRAAGVQSEAKLYGPSLLEWISKQGGIEDRGGDIKSMGGDTWHKGKVGYRKLIRETAAGQSSMLGADGQQNTSSPDELAVRAQEAGYFPPGERPSVNDLLDAIGGELRGKKHYAGDRAVGSDHVRAAADELHQILDEAGLDPAKASDAEISKAIAAYQAQQEGGFQQGEGKGVRGQINFVNGKSVISLFHAANMSTFVHEFGHHLLETLRSDALVSVGTDGNEKARGTFADWETVKGWFASNGHPVVDDKIPVEAHELFARGFERFLMEGKAPSGALKKVFESLKRWMLQIYHVVENLRSPITPEIRDVMSRLVATDEQIDAARHGQAISSLFTDAATAGMSEEAFAAHERAAQDARDEAHDALLYRTMKTIRDARTAAWKQEAVGVRDEISARVDSRPEFKAIDLLRTGQMRGEPNAPKQHVKLDKAWLIENYGEGVLSLLPKGVPPIFAEQGTTHADDIAERVGFTSGDEMVRTLINVEERKGQLRETGDKRSVRSTLIDEGTTAEMRARHGDPFTDGSIEDEALAAVYNDKQGAVFAADLRALSRKLGTEETPTPYSLARDWAREKIASGVVNEVTSGRVIQQYARSAAKAGKAAELALAKNDIDEAFRQKRAQMLNSALASEAGAMRERLEAAIARLARFGKRRTMASMDQGYLEEIHKLLEQVEFRDRSQKSLKDQQSFEAWANARQAEGHDIVVPGSFAASLGTIHWSQLTVEKLIGLDDTVAQIAHLGRLKQKLLDGQEERDFDAVVMEAKAAAEKLPQKAPSDLMDPSWGEKFKSGVASADASLLKMETIFDWLDGGDSEGVFNRVVFKPISDAQDRENAMLKDYYARIQDAMAEVPKETIRRWGDKVEVTEMLNRATGRPFGLTRQNLVAMALNVGNNGNFQRLADGYGWNRSTIMDALNRELSPEEWTFVQKTWDIIDTLWPEIEAMERRINGVAPEKVESRSFETSAGTMRGGYYPAIYDASKDLKAEANAGKSKDLFEAMYTRATTRASATKDREEKVKRPILLQLGVINRHIGEVVHDITHREVIMNADKFLSSERVMAAVDQSLGKEIRQQFRPWLKFVANQWAIEKAGNEGLGNWINKARSNATIVGMGFRITTMLSQIAGYTNSFEYVGAKWVTAAIAKTTASPIATYKFVTERSGEVRNRMDTLDRDIREGINRMAGVRTPLADAKRFAFHGIGYMDRVVAIPTWLGAYDKALAAGKSEDAAIYEGDKAVRMSQGAGAAKDMAAVVRGTGKYGMLFKLMTMFYSFQSMSYQRNRTLGRDVAQAAREGNLRASPRLVARAFWLIAAGPPLAAILAGHGPRDDEDWGWWTVKQMLSQLLGPIPGVRDIVEPVWDAFAGNKSFGYQLSPLQQAGDALVQVAQDAHHAAHGERTRHATKDVLQAAGYFTGLVPGQVASAAQFFVDLGNGDQHPETVADWYRGVTTGEAKKKR